MQYWLIISCFQLLVRISFFLCTHFCFKTNTKIKYIFFTNNPPPLPYDMVDV